MSEQISIGKITMSVEAFNTLSEEKLKLLQKLEGGKSTRKKQPSVCGAKDMNTEIYDKDGVQHIRFKAEGYATRSRTVEEMRTAKALVVKEQVEEPSSYNGAQYIKGASRPVSVAMVTASENLL